VIEPILKAFSQADTSGLPLLDQLSDERAQILWILAVGARQEASRSLTASDISEVLRESYGYAVSRQRVSAILGNERTTVHHSKVGGRWVYRIMKPGLSELEANPVSTVFVRPEEALSGIRRVQEVFSTAKGDVRICDPYVDAHTIDLLADFNQATSIRLLTMNVDKPGAFKRDSGLFTKQHGIPLEVRVAPPKLLHDRYAIHDDGMLLCGTSLNGLGKKQSFIVALGEDIRRAVSLDFDSYWANATPL
jgi:hypothetical protein